MNNRIDHFMYAVASLDEGMEWAADTFGIAPAYGGEHIGLGTRNALLSLGDTYLEIIAPDPAQALANTLGERFEQLSTGGLVTWAVQGALRAVADCLAGLGIETAGPNRTERKTTDGEILVWELLFPFSTPYGARLPFFIDWLACAHPSVTNPPGGQFEKLTVTDPSASRLQGVFDALGLDVAVEAGEAAMSVEIAAAKGVVTLTTTPETVGMRMR